MNYSEELVNKSLVSGRTVFIDFTAAWCLTCQLNKKVALQDADVLAALAAKDVVLVRADWTRYDERITTALERLGKNSIPVYVLLKPNEKPILLPELLTKKIVLDYLHEHLN